MEKPSSVSDSGLISSPAAVFIDTNLDTHLATIVSDTETVSDLKKKIIYEHPLCFPCIGEIKIHAIKVKRRGHYYHLADSMLVKSAFDGISKSWFLSVDALSVGEKSDSGHHQKMDSGKQAACLGIIENPSANEIDSLADGPSKRLLDTYDFSSPFVESNQNRKLEVCADQHDSGDSNKEVLKASEMEVEHAGNLFRAFFCGTHTGSAENTAKNCEVSVAATANGLDPVLEKEYNDLGTSTRLKDENCRKEISDAQGNLSLEATPKTEPLRKKKLKSRKERVDALNNHHLDGNNAKGVLQLTTAVLDDPLIDIDRVASYGVRGSKNTANKPHRSSSSDVNKQSGADVQIVNVQGEGTEVAGEQVDHENDKSENDINIQGNKSLEASVSGFPAKKKRKIKRKDGNQDFSTTNMHLIFDSSKQTTTQYSLGTQQKGSSSDVNRQSGAEVQIVNIQGEVTEVVGERVDNENDKSENDINIQGNKSLEASVSASPAKKKHKLKRKDGNQNFSTTDTHLISDSTKETTTQYSLGGQQKGSNAHIDQLAKDPFEVNHVLTDGVSTGKRKRKYKSSDTSGKDVVQDSSGVAKVGIGKVDLGGEFAGKLTHGQGGPGELISETCTTSSEKKPSTLVKDAGEKDVGVGSTNAGISRSKKDAAKFFKASASEKHESDDVETKLEKNGVSASEDFILKDKNRMLTDKTTRTGEERESCQSKDPEAMTNSLVEREINANGTLGSEKSSKKRKKSRRTQEVGGTADPSSIEHVAADAPSMSYKVVNDEQFHISAEKEAADKLIPNVLGETLDLSGIEDVAANTPSVVPQRVVTGEKFSVSAEKEATDKVIQGVLESLQDSIVKQENLEKTGQKTRKKTMKKKSSTAVKLRELQSEDENVAPKDLISSIGNKRQMDDSFKLSNIAKLAETTSTNQLNVTNSELKIGGGVEIDPLTTQLSARGVGSSKVGSREEEPSGDVVNNEPSKSGSASKINNSIQLSCLSEKINVNDKLSPSQSQREIVASSEMLDRAKNEMKIKKSKKMLDVSSDGPFLSRSSVKSNDNQSGVKADAANSSTSQQERSLLKDENDKLKPKSNKKIPKLSENGAKNALSNKIDKSVCVTAEAQRPTAVNSSRTSAHVASNSSFDSSKETIPQTKKDGNGQSHLSVKGASRKNNDKVVNKSEKEKSLLAKSGSIFRDENSEDEDKGGSSDASTRTPSQISSDYSDGDSDANFNSPENGSYSSHSEEYDGRHITKSFSSAAKNMTFDEILRSSSRYKKAKLAASQSQAEDDDDLPVDFVPESQAN